ncbi:hypothetical protein B1A_12486 [mine drainage metagenome]|uniref:Rhodopirellula transposase family protein n=1 Tax=mine drainage metagenome TaxID=410659 RepID=T1BG70_9ZZZZ
MDTDRQYKWWIKAISGADEVQARRFAAAIALELGHGGVSRVVELTGMSHLTIDKGIKELKTQKSLKSRKDFVLLEEEGKELRIKIQGLLQIWKKYG